MELTYTLNTIQQLIGGRLFGIDTHIPVDLLLTDSRRASFPRRTLFFAIVTQRNDGHKYIDQLIASGVRNFCVSRLPQPLPAGCGFLLVDDTLLAFQQLVAAHRSRFTIPVIGITGSNGKTIVKEWLWQLLSPEKAIMRSPKSYNSQTGVPLSVWQLNAMHQLGIFEAGISEPGEMERLEPIIRPTLGVFTNIGHAHDQFFNTQTQKINEKLKLFKRAELLIYCRDHQEIHQQIDSLLPELPVFTWGKNQDATLRITKITPIQTTTRIEGNYLGRFISINIPFTDEASVENAIHCWAVMLLMGYGAEIVSHRMLLLQPVAMRLELKEGINNCSVINDTYSSDPESLAIALDFMANQHQHERKTVIISELKQSMTNEDVLYTSIADMLENKGISRLIGIGPALKAHSNLFSIPAEFYDDTAGFIADFKTANFNNETILIKGARVFGFEKISQLLQQRSHETVLEVNLDALVHNLNYYRSMLPGETALMAMVKAFSYGSGSYEIANVLQFHRVDYLTVAYADEGVDLRKAGIHMPIMVMNPEESGMESMLRYKLEPEIYNFRSLNLLLRAIKYYGFTPEQPVNIHIKLDTGMHRLGFEEADINDLILRLKENPELRVQSAFSHLVASDDPALDDFTRQQFSRFDAMTRQLKQGVGYKFLRHILNSAGIRRFPEAHFDMVRLGISLYGISGDTLEQQNLETVSSLKTSISQIKIIAAGDSVGYNRAWKSTRDTVIATVPIGYADGLSRQLSNGVGSMMINGQRAPVVGNICMDMTMLDITGIPAAEGDEVVVFGNEPSIVELALSIHTIPYEILTGISRRVKRVYFQE
ncbi:MAG: bifunctional UDP-N-acetylmuramoyl-tripeptide:D-alanyl-D-alanine ligase/alanine racemase [Lentimicrobium sp.]|jgi:alanine racemase|nr:bifunctional UDP-N-acetylmuramoyl-tripeptide:D-alanyl-D-alanine ligase/alanine racemase [Lentimicrobium sp.]MDY0025061.1 bifunctional UDP-N-acetylmuramoyl-tripeptide:D-alanyl-D-alanine ligase/alanine racemase [Lentimicrobium sp.]